MLFIYLKTTLYFASLSQDMNQGIKILFGIDKIGNKNLKLKEIKQCNSILYFYNNKAHKTTVFCLKVMKIVY